MQWNPSESRALGAAGRLLAMLFCLFAQRSAALGDATNEAPKKFEVLHYLVEGNTVLSQRTLDADFAPATGREISFDQINAAMLALQKEYRDRGLITVLVTLPRQKLTNATVRVKVVESPLAVINVTGNRYFSSNNILRRLPSLRTNILLNSFVLQSELDHANAGRDYTLYSVLGPGPEPETSAMTIRVKDQLPLHARLELDNFNTPGSPALRANFNAQYDNLWDLDHQAGVQYSFSPEFEKYIPTDESVPLDSPLIANYSGYYRIPLGTPDPVQDQINARPSKFGYNEDTHKFALPVSTTGPELNLFASRATTDTGIQLGSLDTVVNDPFINIESQTSGENTTLDNDIGARFSFPLPPMDDLKLTLSGGVDFSQYRQASYNTNNFYETVISTNAGGKVSTTLDPIFNAQPARLAKLEYLPLNLGLDAVVPDRFGQNFIGVSLGFNPLPILSGNNAFAAASYSSDAKANYVYGKFNFRREQKIAGDWSVSLRANGQWADTPLAPFEQYHLGGQTTVRGYHEGEVVGDSGWNLSLEPHTPYYKIASVGAAGHALPCSVRFSTFLDYGQVYLASAPAGSADHTTVAGTGFGGTMNVGEHLNAQLTASYPLLDSPAVRSGVVLVTFSLSAQF